ncbi:MAG: TonB-dependent receptor plug domain-containing protein [Opitutaceae bacterium]
MNLPTTSYTERTTFPKRIASAFLISFLPLFLAPATAADKIDERPIYELAPVIVKTERIGTSASTQSGTSELAFQEDFSVWEPTDAAELLRYFPNINASKPSIGSSEPLISVRDQSALSSGRLWVLVDGFPISNPLRTGAGGAARLNLVDPQTIDSVEIQYGPFSASYGGYAMGGVISYKTLPVDESSGQLGIRYFWHDFSLYGTENVYEGHRANFSFTERLGDFGIGISGSHVEEDGHPRRFFSTTNFSTVVPGAPPAGPPGAPPSTPVEGAFLDKDPHGNDRIVYGALGTRQTTTSTVGLKLDHYFDQATLRWTSRFSDRASETELGETYLTNSLTGAPVASGPVVQDGRSFNISPSLAGNEESNSTEWLNGIGLSGELDSNWEYDLSLSYLTILEQTNSNANRIADTPEGFWLNGKATLAKKSMFENDRFDGLFGYEWTAAKIEEDAFDGAGTFKQKTGGQTGLHALFASVGWQINSDFRAIFGVRADAWETTDGFAEFFVTEMGITRFERDDYTERDTETLSPKFSLEYDLTEKDQIRLNLAQTHRFPLVQELYRQEVLSTGELLLSEPNLQPEKSDNIELSWIREIEGGRLRFTVFHNSIEDAILQQFEAPTLIPGSGPVMQSASYTNINKVETLGLELFLLKKNLFVHNLEGSIGAGWMDSSIKEYSEDTDVEGNRYPGVPEWRANASLRYNWNRAFTTALGATYQSHVFEYIENTDTRNTVEAVGKRLFFNLSARYRIQDNFSVSLQIDNLLDEVAFTNGPERHRTFSVGVEWRY